MCFVPFLPFRLMNNRLQGNFPEYTSRRVHVAEWIDGEKLSQSTADDVGALVNLGVITYLTQLLDFGFFHAVSLFITCRLLSPYVSLP